MLTELLRQWRLYLEARRVLRNVRIDARRHADAFDADMVAGGEL
jgi:hypothetical protein